MISDCMLHDTTAVHCFLINVITKLKQIYFSNDTSSQHKNFKNLLNLCHQEGDHKLSVEWNVFATSHGKSSCDGVDGNVNRLVASANLQMIDGRGITSPQEMFGWASENIRRVNFEL